ncbi:MAG: hypothetical protein LIO40_03740 [Ruminococcus sp.]|nr:hypothetical protein [Ruminococcus sp.]
MNVKLTEFLKEYDAEIPESVRDGELYKLTYTQKLDSISFYVYFQKKIYCNERISF